MVKQWFFLTPRWIGSGCIITGFLTAWYSFFRLMEYLIYGFIPPLIHDTPAMSFSTALLLLADGIALAWAGWVIKHLRPDVLIYDRSSKVFSDNLPSKETVQL